MHGPQNRDLAPATRLSPTPVASPHQHQQNHITTQQRQLIASLSNINSPRTPRPLTHDAMTSAPTIYPDYCHSLSPTIGKWCPLTATDVHRLKTVGMFCDGTAAPSALPSSLPLSHSKSSSRNHGEVGLMYMTTRTPSLPLHEPPRKMAAHHRRRRRNRRVRAQESLYG